MIGVALVVPHVALQLRLGCFSFRFFCCKASVFFLRLVQIALIVSTGRGTMILPVAHADPAELELALRACHVITSLVFLDVSLALGTCLGVCSDPCHILRFSIGLLVPLLSCGAVNWLVRMLATNEAEDCSAFTSHIVEHAADIVLFHAKFALYIWAPLYVLVLIGEGLAEPLPVGLLVLGRGSEDSLENCMAHHHIATRLHASGVNALIARSHFLTEIFLPALPAESVFASQ